MIAKVIAHSATRDQARRRLISALGATAVFGPRATRDFLIDALARPAFAEGKATTAFIGETYGGDGFNPTTDERLCAAAAVLQHACALARWAAAALDVSPMLLEWTSAGTIETVVEYEIAGAIRKHFVRPLGRRNYSVRTDEQTIDITIVTLGEQTARLRVASHTVDAIYLDDGRTIRIATPTRTLEFVNLASFVRPRQPETGKGVLLAPMHGKLADICVAQGASVKKGDRLAVLEAMKMQHELVAEIDGRIARIVATSGVQIAARDLILEIEPVTEGMS